MAKNVFVVGLDEINRTKLEAIRDADRFRFHELLGLDSVQGAAHFPVEEWMREATRRLDDFDGSIDGIIGFWDFPISLMVPVLRERYGTPGASLDVVARCEHKYWSRILQRESIPEAVPEFQAVDPFADDAVERIEIDFPLWLKPVKAFASQLGFRIDDEESLRTALETIRDGIDRFAEPFDRMIEDVERPDEVAGIGGRWCVAEEIMKGSQHTVAGFARGDDVEIYGVIDSINYPDSSSFFRYRYPSHLPHEVTERAGGLARRVMDHVGFRDSPFNIEFFHDEEDDGLMLLEINTRISQSHSDLFDKVDGTSNHEVLVELATGSSPDPPAGEGDFACASKFHFRHFEDGTVTRVPGADDVERLREEIPGALVLVQVEEGDRLSRLPDQDAYSYRLGVVYLGADDDEQLMERWERAHALLPFAIDGERI